MSLRCSGLACSTSRSISRSSTTSKARNTLRRHTNHFRRPVRSRPPLPDPGYRLNGAPRPLFVRAIRIVTWSRSRQCTDNSHSQRSVRRRVQEVRAHAEQFRRAVGTARYSTRTAARVAERRRPSAASRGPGTPPRTSRCTWLSALLAGPDRWRGRQSPPTTSRRFTGHTDNGTCPDGRLASPPLVAQLLISVGSLVNSLSATAAARPEASGAAIDSTNASLHTVHWHLRGPELLAPLHAPRYPP